MEKQQLLVKFSADWADEFDVSGFTIIDKEEWKNQKKEFLEACKNDQQTGFCFGTNEEWDDIDESWLDNYEVKKISKEEAKLLYKLFDGEFGIFPYLNELWENDNDDDFDEDDD